MLEFPLQWAQTAATPPRVRQSQSLASAEQTGWSPASRRFQTRPAGTGPGAQASSARNPRNRRSAIRKNRLKSRLQAVASQARMPRLTAGLAPMGLTFDGAWRGILGLVRLRALRFLAVVSLFVFLGGSGAHLPLVQIVAWVNMALDDREAASLVVAIGNAMDGGAPCELCLYVTEQREDLTEEPASAETRGVPCFLEAPEMGEVVPGCCVADRGYLSIGCGKRAGLETGIEPPPPRAAHS